MFFFAQNAITYSCHKEKTHRIIYGFRLTGLSVYLGRLRTLFGCKKIISGRNYGMRNFIIGISPHGTTAHI
jgi:hypothetical protein